MAYLLLAFAIAAELVATTLLEYSAGFTKIAPTACSLALYAFSFFCLSRALLSIDLGIAYATWSAVGMVITSIIGLLLFRQQISMAGVFGLALIIVGVIILNLFGHVD